MSSYKILSVNSKLSYEIVKFIFHRNSKADNNANGLKGWNFLLSEFFSSLTALPCPHRNRYLVVVVGIVVVVVVVEVVVGQSWTLHLCTIVLSPLQFFPPCFANSICHLSISFSPPPQVFEHLWSIPSIIKSFPSESTILQGDHSQSIGSGGSKNYKTYRVFSACVWLLIIKSVLFEYINVFLNYTPTKKPTIYFITTFCLRWNIIWTYSSVVFFHKLFSTPCKSSTIARLWAFTWNPFTPYTVNFKKIGY